MKNYLSIASSMICILLLSACGAANLAALQNPTDKANCTVTSTCSVKLGWNAPVQSDGSPQALDGYKVYWGTASHSYDHVLSVGNVLEATVTGFITLLQLTTSVLMRATSRTKSAQARKILPPSKRSKL